MLFRMPNSQCEPKLGMKRQVYQKMAIILVFGLLSLACKTDGTTSPVRTSSLNNRAAQYGYEIVNTWPHDKRAYTQGLIFHEGKLIESTGRQGESSLRRVELESGKVLDKVDLPYQYFAEGTTLLNGRIYQLTWEHQKGFIYDAATLSKIGEFSYAGEGWGLTHDGESLILSDGSNRLRFIDPATFQVKRTISVADQNIAIRNLNELEYVKGEILANIWHADKIARINPQTGQITGWIDLSRIQPANELSDEEAVLNGIAYDATSGRLFVTGKLWPKLFEIRIKEK
jgi:glutamine cyclotransferase